MNPFSSALRTAITASGKSLVALSRELRARGAPASVSTLSGWQTGENHPERASSLAALATLEEILGLPPRTLLALVPSRRPRGRWRAPASTTLPHRRMWRSPEAVERVLARLDAAPADLYVPARVSRTVKIVVDGRGFERESHHRNLLRGGREETTRVFGMLRSASLPRLPVVAGTDGCRPGRMRADVPAALTAFELLLDTPLRPDELRQIDFVVRFPPGQRERHMDLRVPPGLRDVVVQAAFDPACPPRGCAGFYQAAQGRPETPLDAGNGPAWFQFAVIDPAPGIYGIRWEWD
ncbi:hypothetical protein Afil01_68060 [Actinorhabdospora filicis]|uniref:Uncharacterized protein n=1 Tax=Actinorhabdospora filicis TaxID=1785913 RepID=A0A9W6SU49_9ACTN|nr:hypothetical protein [Actinorhabdospora filicis]GLZ81999.1 hypothetical protein Afil01_68060 [Actinorhabdospora filicis]